MYNNGNDKNNASAINIDESMWKKMRRRCGDFSLCVVFASKIAMVKQQIKA